MKGPGWLTPFYIWKHGGIKHMVPVLLDLHRDFGDVVKLQIGPRESAVVLFNPDHFMEVHRATSCPYGATDALWMLHEHLASKENSMKYGQGQHWMNVRRLMQPQLLPPKAANSYQEGIAQVVEEALTDDMLLHSSLQRRFFERTSFAMVCNVLLGSYSAEEDDLLQATVRSMECASAMLMGPLQRLNKTFNTQLWKDWTNNVDFMIDRTEQLVSQAIDGHSATTENPCYAARLAADGRLTRREIVAHIPGLMMAGFETVASTLHWTMIHLARNPRVQEELRDELLAIVGTSASFRREHLPKLPYLRCVTREVHRITPTAFAFVRKLPSPLKLDSAAGIVLPANSWLCFSPVGISNQVEDPHQFRPERFLDRVATRRGAPERTWTAFDHPLMRDGFGFGARRCLGASVAKLEIYSFCTAALQRFRVSIDGEAEYGIANHAATFPDPAPHLVFEKLT